MERRRSPLKHEIKTRTTPELTVLGNNNTGSSTTITVDRSTPTRKQNKRPGLHEVHFPEHV